MGDITDGDIITFAFKSATNDLVHLLIYGNGSETASFNVTVNGKTENEALSVSVGAGSWWTFPKKEFTACELNLKEGETYTVKLTSNGSNMQVNLDYLRIVSYNPDIDYDGNETTLGAEKASLSGKCNYNADGGFIDGMSAGATISYTVNSSVDSVAALTASVSGGAGNTSDWGWTETLNEAFTVTVNGKSYGPFNVGPTTWTGFTEVSIGYVSFNKGANTVIITAGDNVSANLNLQSIKLSPVNCGVYGGQETIISHDNTDFLTLEGGAAAQSGNGGIIGGINNRSKITLTFKSEVDGKVALKFNARGKNTVVNVNLNGSAQSPVTLTSDNPNSWWMGSFADFDICEIEVEAGGVYVIELTFSDEANIHNFTISPV